MSTDAGAVYRDVLVAGGARVCDDAAAFASDGELALQARWFAGEFGREWRTVDGASAIIEDFGRWNHEAGPDFVGARVRIAGREFRGAIEIDLDARDWERHGHATNPAFDGTVVHVFVHRPGSRFFTRTSEHREVAQVHLSAPLPPSRRPGSAVEPVTLEIQKARAILEAAARHRLDAKAQAIRNYALVHGEDNAWFAAMATALGYKHNQTPFLLLAQRLGWRTAGGDDGEARLFGVAGFLERPEPPAATSDVRAYLCGLWERWWAERARCERWILPAAAWRFHGLRPANHPHRRVAALAAIAAAWPKVRRALADAHRAEFVSALESLEHPFWAARFNLESASLDRPQALVGAERIGDMGLNILDPLAVARDNAAWGEFLARRGPAPAAIMRAAAGRFFGGTMDGELRRAVIQQGLLQIERDYRTAPDPEAFLTGLRCADFPPPREISTPGRSRR